MCGRAFTNLYKSWLYFFALVIICVGGGGVDTMITETVCVRVCVCVCVCVLQVQRLDPEQPYLIWTDDVCKIISVLKCERYKCLLHFVAGLLL